MTKNYKFKTFKDYNDERADGNLLYKFVIVVFLFYVAVIILSQVFYAKYAYVTINGASMQNTLNPNGVYIEEEEGTFQDGVYIEFTKDVDYKDIVILETDIPTIKKGGTIIKRVLGLGGDYVSIIKVDVGDKREFRLLRKKKNSSNIEILKEDYIKSYDEWSELTSIRPPEQNVDYEYNFYTEFNNPNYQRKSFAVEQLDGLNVIFYQVPEGEIFFLGDNRAYSRDSRIEGTYKTDAIDGKVVEIVRDGHKYKGNDFWWFNQFVGFLKVCWSDILSFFS